MFKLINDSYQEIQNTIIKHGNVIATFVPSKQEQEDKAKHFITYVIGLLAIHKSQIMEASKTKPIIYTTEGTVEPRTIKSSVGGGKKSNGHAHHF